MTDKSDKVITGKLFLLSFLLFLIISIILASAMLCLARLRSNAIAVYQYSLYGVLKEDAATSHESVPSKFSPVRLSQAEYYLKDADTYYYTDAWYKPGRVLLKKKWGRFYYLTFGDGSRAVVTYWSLYGADDPNVKPHYIQPTTAERYNYVEFWVIPLGAITIVVTLLLEQKFERKSRQGTTPSAGG